MSLNDIEYEEALCSANIVSMQSSPSIVSMQSSPSTSEVGPMKLIEAEVRPRTAIYDDLRFMIVCLLDDMSKKKYCFDEMDCIARIGNEMWTSYDSHFQVSIDTFKIAADRLQQTSKEVDIRICTHYLKAFRIIFLFTKDHDTAMRYVYGLEFKLDNTDITLPMFHRFYENFDSHLDGILRRIAETDRLDEDLVRELAFVLMITPRHVLRVIVVSFVQNLTGYDTVRVMRVLRRIPAFCQLRFGLSNCEGVSRSIIIAFVYHCFILFGRGDRSAIDFSNEEQRIRLASILQLFTTTRTVLRDGATVCLPIFDPNDLVADFACQQFHPCASRNPINLRFALELMYKLVPARDAIQGKQPAVDRCVIRWSGNVANVSTGPAVSIGLFMRYLADACMTSTIDYGIKVEALSLLSHLGTIVEELSLNQREERVNRRLSSTPQSVRSYR